MKRSLILALFSTILFAGSLTAASDYLLEIDGIKGESSDDRHRGTIEIESFSWGLGNSSVPGVGAGKVSFSDFSFTTILSKVSPQIMAQCAMGKHIPKAVMYGRKLKGDALVDYYKVTLKDVIITSYQQSAGGGTPRESVSIAYTSIQVDYTNDAGSIETGTASLTTVTQ